MPTSIEQYRALIARVLQVSQSLEERDARLRSLGAELLETAARMDAILRHIEWGCPPDSANADCRDAVLEIRTALACVTKLLVTDDRAA